MEQNPDIKVALNGVRACFDDQKKARDYVEGKQPDVFDAAKWADAFGDTIAQPKDNLCGLIVRQHRARLKPTKFAGVEKVDEEGAEKATALWKRLRFDRKAAQAIDEALSLGDAYLSVEHVRGKTAVHVLRADEAYVHYDPESPDDRLWGARVFQYGDQVRVTLAYPDRTERWITTRDSTIKDADRFEHYLTDESDPESWREENGTGICPIFHLPCDPDLKGKGRSVIAQCFGLQDFINMQLADLSVTAYHAAYPQRVLTGVQTDTTPLAPVLGQSLLSGGELKFPLGGAEPAAPERTQEAPFENGIDRVWTLSNDQAKGFQFDAADLKQYLDSLSAARQEMARLGEVPPHSMQLAAGDAPSGESLRASEATTVNADEYRQLTMGDVLEEVFSYAVWVDETHDQDGNIRDSVTFEQPSLNLLWAPAETSYELTANERLEGLIAMGAPMEIILEFCYDLSPAEAQKIADLKAEKDQAALDMALLGDDNVDDEAA